MIFHRFFFFFFLFFSNELVFWWGFCFLGENHHTNYVKILMMWETSHELGLTLTFSYSLFSHVFSGPFLSGVFSWQHLLHLPADTSSASHHATFSSVCPLSSPFLLPFRPADSFVHQWNPLCPCQSTFWSVYKKQTSIKAEYLTCYASSSTKVRT